MCYEAHFLSNMYFNNNNKKKKQPILGTENLTELHQYRLHPQKCTASSSLMIERNIRSYILENEECKKKINEALHKTTFGKCLRLEPKVSLEVWFQLDGVTAPDSKIFSVNEWFLKVVNLFGLRIHLISQLQTSFTGALERTGLRK